MSNRSVRPYRAWAVKGEDAEVSARLYGAPAGLAKNICPTVAHWLCGALFLDRDVSITHPPCDLRAVVPAGMAAFSFSLASYGIKIRRKIK